MPHPYFSDLYTDVLALYSWVHSVSTTRVTDPQATNAQPIPEVVPTVKRPREEGEDADIQNKKKKRRKKSGQQSK